LQAREIEAQETERRSLSMMARATIGARGVALDLEQALKFVYVLSVASGEG
jgi:hypothetical protein